MNRCMLGARQGVDPNFFSNTAALWRPPFEQIDSPCWLVVDPGVSRDGGCGWSVWATTGGRLVEPLFAGVFLRVLEEWNEQSYLNFLLLQKMSSHMKFAGLAVEYPAYWHGDPRSRAALRSGALGKVFYQAGQIATLHPFSRLVTVAEWKGHKSKEETRIEVEKALGEVKLKKLLGKKPDHNGIDSLGIGLFLKRSGG